jgi:hypothetical protein
MNTLSFVVDAVPADDLIAWFTHFQAEHPHLASTHYSSNVERLSYIEL